IITLGALSAFANWYVLQGAQSLNHVNQTMVERVAPARLALAEAKAALNNIGLAAYKSMATSEPDAAHAANDEISNHIAAVRQWLRAVSDYFPTRIQDCDAIQEKLRHVEATARQIRDAILSGDKQRRMNEMLDLRFEAALD